MLPAADSADGSDDGEPADDQAYQVPPGYESAGAGTVIDYGGSSYLIQGDGTMLLATQGDGGLDLTSGLGSLRRPRNRNPSTRAPGTQIRRRVNRSPMNNRLSGRQMATNSRSGGRIAGGAGARSTGGQRGIGAGQRGIGGGQRGIGGGQRGIGGGQRGIGGGRVAWGGQRGTGGGRPRSGGTGGLARLGAAAAECAAKSMRLSNAGLAGKVARALCRTGSIHPQCGCRNSRPRDHPSDVLRAQRRHHAPSARLLNSHQRASPPFLRNLFGWINFPKRLGFYPAWSRPGTEHPPDRHASIRSVLAAVHAVIAGLDQLVRDQNGSLALCGPQPAVREMRRICWWDQIFENYADESTPLASLRESG